MPERSFSEPETFTPEDVGHVVRSTLLTTGCLAILAGALAWFLVTSLLSAAGAHLPMLWGALIALVIVALMMGIKALQVRASLSASKLVASPAGLEQHDGKSAVRRLSWQGMVAADLVAPVGRMGRPAAGTAASQAIGQAAGTAAVDAGKALGRSVGIVGYGEIDVHNPALRRVYTNQFGVGPDGRELVGLAPAIIAQQWLEGGIGAWVAHYRPDIFAHAQALDAWYRAGAQGPQPTPGTPTS